MSVSEAVSKRRRRSFGPKFKREIVALCLLPGNWVASVCKEYVLAETAVASGSPGGDRRRAPAGADHREAEEIAGQGKRLREVTEERDILARAVGFLAKRTR